jgi:diguanylate cyclase (GGDEF)-like protein
MAATHGRGNLRGLAFAAFLCCAAGAVAYLSIQLIAENLMRQDTSQSANEWSNYVSGNVPDLDDILGGELPSPDSIVFLEQSRKVGRVNSFALYDRDMNLKVRSEELGKMQTYTSNLRQQQPALAQTLRNTGSAILDERVPAGDHFASFSRAIVPLAEGRGWIEIWFDQTGRRQAIFDWASRVGIFGSLLFGAIPALWIRRRQRAAAARALEETKLRHLALTDSLTGLANRNAFFAALDRHMAKDSGLRREDQIAVHLVDLDDFKTINDTLGHDAGDRLLAKVAEILQTAVGRHGFAARIGGDEFAIIQTNTQNDASALGLARKVLDAMSETIRIRDTYVVAKCSIGVAVAMPGEIDVTVLTKRADLALYAAKSSGKSVARLFDAAIEAAFDRDRLLAVELAKACETMAFELHYQPVFQLDGGKLIGFEALLRLPKAGGGFTPPMDFIPVAEETGKIDMIGAWVLRESCRAAAAWGKDLIVAVNLSPVQFRAGNIVAQVEEALEASAAPA